MEWSREINIDGIIKRIEVRCYDITKVDETYDLLVCSVFKRAYSPFDGTLIKSLYDNKNISVGKEAESPLIDYRDKCNYWVSKETGSNFKRIACIELLDSSNKESENIKELCMSFATLYNMLDELDRQGIAPDDVILPVLGSGNQQIELCYIVPPLITQCIKALQNIKALKTITFCDKSSDKTDELIHMIDSVWKKKNEGNRLFISYCSAQRDYADALLKQLTQRKIKCWMAPYSIPAGSSYQAEIPAALSNVDNVVVILSEEAEKSRWVQKEVGCTIGARHRLIPVRMKMYDISSQFGFLLDGEQILDAKENISDEQKCIEAADYIASLIKKDNVGRITDRDKDFKDISNAGCRDTRKDSGNILHGAEYDDSIDIGQSITHKNSGNIKYRDAHKNSSNIRQGTEYSDRNNIRQRIAHKDSGNIRYRAVHKNSKKSATDLIFMGIGLAIVAELGVIIRKLDK